jgi:alkylation response protein AidB-like acyl-CoA dehydrogenase
VSRVSGALVATATDATLPELRAELRAFIVAELGEDWFPLCDSWQRGFSRSFSEALGRGGWLGLTLPSKWGGGGRSAVERFAVAEELLAAGAPVAAHWITERQVAPSILRNGTDWQREQFLPGILRGKIVFAIGMSEPGSGSDLASVKSHAELRGGAWVLNGQKVWSSFAHEADYLLVLCRTSEAEDRHQGLSQLIVDTSLPGVDVRRIRTMGGDDHFCEIFFRDVAVPAECLLGTEGNAWAQVNAELAYERGGPERYLSAWPLYSEFAQLIGASDDRLLAEVFGGFVAELTAVRQLSIEIAVEMDAGGDFRVAAAVEKDAGTALEQRMVEAIGTLASAQFQGDERFTRLLCEASAAAPAFTLRGGTTEILRTIIARQIGETSKRRRLSMVERLADEVFSEYAERRIAARGIDPDPDQLWSRLQALELTVPAVPEDLGGAGGTIDDQLAILRAAGRHAIQLPLLETGLLAGWLRARHGVAVDAGPMKVDLAQIDDDWEREQLRRRGALGACVLACAAIDSIKDLTVSYVSERQQFGRPLRRFQAVEHQLAVMLTQGTLADAALRAALPPMLVGEELPLMQIAAAKVVCGRAAARVSKIGHQLHGAIGITREYPLALLTTSALRCSSQFGGSREWAQSLGQKFATDNAWQLLTATEVRDAND